MLLNRNTIFPAAVTAKPIQYALGALRRDFDRIFAATAAPGGRLLLTINHTLAAEQYTLTAGTDTLLLSASDDLGFVYGLFEISRHFLGVQPFWFWNDQPFEVRESVKIPTNTVIESKPARVTYRGWFINDETLLSHPAAAGRQHGYSRYRQKRAHLPPGSSRYGGLIITHHHAEPLGAEMFAQAYPDLEPMYSKYPEKFRALWQAGIDA